MGKNKNEVKDEVLVEEPMEGAYCKEGVAHYVTELDLEVNDELSEEIKIGDLIYIPFTPEQAAEYKIALEKENKDEDIKDEDEKNNEDEDEEIKEEVKSGYRECTCGALVALPSEGEGPTKCDCGVEHIW